MHLGELRAALGGVKPCWLLAFAGLNVSTLVLRTFQTQSLVRRKDGTDRAGAACARQRSPSA